MELTRMFAAIRLRAPSAEAQPLYWCMTALAISLLPHLNTLPYWIPLLIVTAAAWRIVIEVRGFDLPPRWLRIFFAGAAMITVAATFRTLNGLDAGTALLATMSGIKLLETRGVRDCTILIFIGFVLLFSALLYDQSLLRLPYILAAAIALGAALLRVHQSSQPMLPQAALKMTGVIVLQALPVTLLLFVLFPRLPGQFWALPSRDNAATGLSDEMTPGNISELTISGAVAFRVEFEGALPPPVERYWRGPVLHNFDGRSWRGEPVRRTLNQDLETAGPTYKYRLTIEPTQRPWLFPLDVPTEWPENTIPLYDFQLVARRPIAVLSSYELQSHTTFRSTQLPRSLRLLDTYLPRNSNPRTRALAQQLHADAGSDAAFIQAVLMKFRREAFYYTLTPPKLGADSVDEFLFETRRGFCEHFASAFATLMRAANIPARVVTGYQGGQYNALGNYLLVRQSDAHAWTEVWLDNLGWTRIDPTAAVAPERIEKNMDAAIPAREAVPGRFLRTNLFFSRARLTWDAVNNFWNNRIVEYDELKQRALLAWFGIDNNDWRSAGIAFAVTIAIFFVALTMYLSWKYRPTKNDPVAALYDKLCRKLERVNLPRQSYEGPSDYLHRAATTREEIAPTLNEVRSLYVELRYGPTPQSAALKKLKALVRQLRV